MCIMQVSIAASLIFVIFTAIGFTPPAQAANPLASSTAPCFIELPKIYLDINHVRHHISDWDTFLNLGYKQTDIVPCADAASDPEGTPITRLLKGSGDEVYWMDNGQRRHIPNMDTFTALGFQIGAITVLPDDALAWWPLGAPLPTSKLPTDVLQQRVIGTYTVELHHSTSLTNFATISAPGQTAIRIDDVEGFGNMPSLNVTGDGAPDVMFLTRATAGSHCCWGTVVYELGTTAIKILDLADTAYYYGATGRGEFKDLDGDGAYEFVTHDPLMIANAQFPCSEPQVQVALAYNPTLQQYVGASPQFASYYADSLHQLTSQAQKGGPNGWCNAQPLVVTLLYLGKTADAKMAFDQYYKGSDGATFWVQLQTDVDQGRSYVAAN